MALGSGYKFEQRLAGVGRVDAVDFANKIVRELKPDAPSGRAQGARQLARYIRDLAANGHGNFTGYLDFYRP